VQQIINNANGDNDDLLGYLSSGDLPTDPMLGSHCSGFIKVTEGDLFTAHTTWDLFSSMLRVYKIYNFHLKDKSTTSTSMSFSSYPGTICGLLYLT
jgi:hypothetical protein